jgi:hypothetical protein
MICLAARLLPSLAGLSHAGQAVLGVAFAGVVLWVQPRLFAGHP